jgi:phosphatidate phosphatase PAH1
MTPTIVIGKITAFEISWKMGQEEGPTSSKPYALACDEHKRLKAKKKALSSSSSIEEEEEEDENDEEENDQASTSSSKDKKTVRRVEKVMWMIRKINLMGVPLQVEDLLFNIDRKKTKKEMMLCMWEERPLQGQLSKYGRTHKKEEQRQDTHKCQDLG